MSSRPSSLLGVAHRGGDLRLVGDVGAQHRGAHAGLARGGSSRLGRRAGAAIRERQRAPASRERLGHGLTDARPAGDQRDLPRDLHAALAYRASRPAATGRHDDLRVRSPRGTGTRHPWPSVWSPRRRSLRPQRTAREGPRLARRAGGPGERALPQRRPRPVGHRTAARAERRGATSSRRCTGSRGHRRSGRHRRSRPHALRPVPGIRRHGRAPPQPRGAGDDPPRRRASSESTSGAGRLSRQLSSLPAPRFLRLDRHRAAPAEARAAPWRLPARVSRGASTTT